MEGKSSDQGQADRYKRKRKKSFLVNARKYAKKGSFGRGAQLDADTYSYFVKMMETFKEGFESEEEKQIFVDNFFDYTEKEEVNHSSNQVGCRVIEMLLPFASDKVIVRFIEAFSSDLRRLCSDTYCSHVLEGLFKETFKRSVQIKKKDDDKSCRQSFKDFTMKVCKFLLNNLEDFIWNSFANHTIRNIIQILLQLPENDSLKSKIVIETIKPEDIPDEYKEMVLEFANRLINWPQFNDLAYSTLTSAFIQVILKALKVIDIKLLKKYLKKLINESFTAEKQISEVNSQNDATIEQSKIPQVFHSKPALMLLEVSLETALPKQSGEIYKKFFSGHLAALAKNKDTNFAVQKLLTNCKDKEEFEAMFDELADCFEEILNAGHTGVLFSLAQGCKIVGAKQGVFIQNMMKVLHCDESEEREKSFVICLCKLVNYESLQQSGTKKKFTKEGNFKSEKDNFNLHGTLVMQCVLEFKKPIKLVNAILELDTNDLKDLFMNVKGSRIADAFIKSEYIGEKSREKLTRKFQGSYQELASTKFGSRAFDALWEMSNVKQKLTIMQELSYKDSLWCNTMYGKIIASKIKLEAYKKNKEEWKASLDKPNNRTDNKSELKQLTKMLNK